MKPNVMLPLALVLSGVILSQTIAEAQPGGGFTYRSLETRIVQSPVVFRGTITSVSEKVIHTNNQYSAYDIFNYTVILKVDEVFKGNLPRKPLEFTIPTVYDQDMTILSKPEDILARARAFAKKRINVARFHSIYLPELSSSDHYFFNSYLTVPVEPSLEQTAKHLMATPEDFISAKSESVLVPQWRCDLRAEGVSALQYFKSAINIKLLKSLLDAPDFWSIKDWSAKYRDMNRTDKIYSVRRKAYEVLKGWGVEVPKPITEEIIPAKETKP